MKELAAILIPIGILLWIFSKVLCGKANRISYSLSLDVGDSARKSVQPIEKIYNYVMLLLFCVFMAGFFAVAWWNEKRLPHLFGAYFISMATIEIVRLAVFRRRVCQLHLPDNCTRYAIAGRSAAALGLLFIFGGIAAKWMIR